MPFIGRMLLNFTFSNLFPKLFHGINAISFSIFSLSSIYPFFLVKISHRGLRTISLSSSTLSLVAIFSDYYSNAKIDMSLKTEHFSTIDSTYF